MGKGSLNVGMLVLCTEAERAAIMLRHHASALPHLEALGLANAGPQRLAALAAQGRAAHTAAGRSATRLKMLQAEGRDLAAELYALHKLARRILRVVELHHDPTVVAEARNVRMALTLHAPRLRAGLDGARFLADALSRSGTPLVVIPAIPPLRDKAQRRMEAARDLVARIQHSHADRQGCARDSAQAYDALRDHLRHLRDAWVALQAMGHPLPDLVFELVHLATAIKTPS